MRKPVITRHPALIRHEEVEVGIEAVLARLENAGVCVWLDTAGKLRVNKDAPAECKNLVREHKQEIVEVLSVQSVSGPVMVQTDVPISATSWAEWKAEALNRLFQEQGRTGQRGRITAATVRHGERKSDEA